MTRVVIGMDPHKRSVTIEVMAPDESVLGGGRYATDAPGYAAMLRDARRWPERVWAVEGCSGTGGTSPRDCRPRAGPTTTARRPRARHRWKLCAASSAGCPTSSTDTWSTTPPAR